MKQELCQILFFVVYFAYSSQLLFYLKMSYNRITDIVGFTPIIDDGKEKYDIWTYNYSNGNQAMVELYTDGNHSEKRVTMFDNDMNTLWYKDY